MATTAMTTMAPLAARAGVPEIDQKTGEMYSPRTEMMGGRGSSAARGIDLRDRRRDTDQQNIRSMLGAKGGPIQTVYETRFVVYLSRFLLNLDPAAKSWWTVRTIHTLNVTFHSNSYYYHPSIFGSLIEFEIYKSV
jgi:hypothetical protein